MLQLSESDPEYPETLLIVDDNEDTALYLKELVEYAGYKAHVEQCGKNALDCIRSKDFDLVILDVVMPEMDGIAVANQIKRYTGNDFLPVIMVTALNSDADKVEGLTYADDYLTKPFSSDELIARIKSLLRTRRLHRELYQTKERYECLYENFPHLYISINSARIITECNRSFRDTFNVSRDDVIGKAFHSFFRDQDKAAVENFLRSFLMSKQPSTGQHVFTVERKGDLTPLKLSLKAVYTDEEKDGLNIVIAMEDVTEQTRMQEEQKIARLQLYRSARLASIGTLASGVAHEINNPLTAILGFSSALLERTKEGEEIERSELDEYLGIINREALRCRDIVENLSKFARESDIEKVRVDLRSCIDDAMKLTYTRAIRANIKVINTIDTDTMIQSNANKLEQVFITLITNCIEFCPPGSQVTIRSVPSTEPERYHRVHIADNGPGIGADILPKVFDLFFTTKEVGKGTGMGLAICHKIMEECNGRIDISSLPGNGTTVVIDLPIGEKGGSFNE